MKTKILRSKEFSNFSWRQHFLCWRCQVLITWSIFLTIWVLGLIWLTLHDLKMNISAVISICFCHGSNGLTPLFRNSKKPSWSRVKSAKLIVYLESLVLPKSYSRNNKTDFRRDFKIFWNAWISILCNDAHCCPRANH